MNHARKQSGTTLIVVLFVIAGLTLVGVAMMGSSTLSMKTSKAGSDDEELSQIAQVGIERMTSDITCALTGQVRPDAAFLTFVNLNGTNGRSMGADGTVGGADDSGRSYVDVPSGRGSYTINISTFPTTPGAALALEYVDVTIRSTANLRSRTKTLQSVVRIKSGASRIFDNAYYAQNYGWLSGWPNQPFYVNGNLRCGTTLDCYHNAFAIGRAMPQFRKVVGDNLIGFINNGGVIAGGRIRNCDNLTEDFAPAAGNRHRFQEALPMPNISDLSFYVGMARTWNGGTPGGDGVWGNADDTGGATLTIWDDRLNDGEGGWRTYRGCIGCGCENGAATGCTGFCRPNPTTLESPYMVLDGRSPTRPIMIDGPVVIGCPGPDGEWNTDDEWDGSPNGMTPVAGGVIIRGWVSGKGAIYSAGNTYIAGNITYTRPPNPHLPGSAGGGWGYGANASTARPTFTKTTIEDWRKIGTVRTADMLGLYARENIVFGNAFLNLNVALAHPAWNTAMQSVNEANLGIDGVRATGDAGENDGVWDVVHYGDVDSCGSGLLPDGFADGDVIPCLKEDVDCDGRRDYAGALGFISWFGEADATGAILAAGESILDRPLWKLNGVLDTDSDGLWWGGSPFYNKKDTCCGEVFDSDDTAQFALHYQYQVPNAAPIDQIHATLYTPHYVIGTFQSGCDTNLTEFYGSMAALVNGVVAPNVRVVVLKPSPQRYPIADCDPTQVTIQSHDPRLLGGGPKNLFLPRELTLEIRNWNEELSP